MKSIKSKSITNFFGEIKKDFPKKLDTFTLEGREFINKYHPLALEIDNKITTASDTFQFILNQKNRGMIDLDSTIEELIKNQIKILEETNTLATHP